MGKHLLFTYSDPSTINNHVDPDYTNLLYGDSGQNGYIIMNNLKEGSYIFFNTRIGNSRYITAYYYIEKILSKGRDDAEILAIKSDAINDEVIVVGSRNFSKILTTPILLDKNLAIQIKSLDADLTYFNNASANGMSELNAISNKTRTPRILNDADKNLLISLCRYKG